MLSLLFNHLFLVRLFWSMCFSEYEFTLVNPSGEEYPTMISFSHFQTKLQAFYSLNRRPPFKEAFFVYMLSKFHTVLIEDCPFVFSSAFLLVSQFYKPIDFSLSKEILKKALDIYSNAAPVDQEIFHIAWSFDLARNSTIADRLVPSISSTASAAGLEIVIFSEFRDRRAAAAEIISHIKESVPEEGAEVYIYEGVSASEVLWRHVNSSDKDLIVLDDEGMASYKDRSAVMSLVRLFLKIYSNNNEIPDFYHFGKRLAPSGKASHPDYGDIVVGPHYEGIQFFVSNRIKRRFSLNSESGESGDTIFLEFYLHEVYSNKKTRCDDDQLVITLRLCLGDEDHRMDWRDTHLSYVLPRRAVIKID
jgi:hypothetical protein